MNTIQGSLRRQRGAVTLVITLLVMIALTIGSFALVQTGTTEKRMTANDQRSRVAFQAAQSGIDFLVASLAQPQLNVAALCEPDNWRESGFLLSFTGPDATGALNFDPDVQSVACLATPFAMLQKTNIWSRGFSEDRESVRTLVSTIDMSSQWRWNYGPASLTSSGGGTGAIIAGGVVTAGGTFDSGVCEGVGCVNLSGANGKNLGSGQNRFAHRTLTPNEKYILAGEKVEITGNAESRLETNWDVDSSLASMTGEDMFMDFVAGAYLNDAGQPRWNSLSDFINDPVVDPLDLGSGKNQTIGAGPLFYVDGDLSLNTFPIGNKDQPVLIVVKGNAKLAGNGSIWGTVVVLGEGYGKGDKVEFDMKGTSALIGSLITPLSVDVKGTAGVYFNADAAGDPIMRLAEELDPDATGQVVTLRVGSWREVADQ